MAQRKKRRRLCNQGHTGSTVPIAGNGRPEIGVQPAVVDPPPMTGGLHLLQVGVPQKITVQHFLIVHRKGCRCLKGPLKLRLQQHPHEHVDGADTGIGKRPAGPIRHAREQLILIGTGQNRIRQIIRRQIVNTPKVLPAGVIGNDLA
ncbi:hypothetical protein D3C75_881250 [compost metagenome]